MDTLDAFVFSTQALADAVATETFGPDVVARWKNPPHAGRLAVPCSSGTVRGGCGDSVTIDLAVAHGRVHEAGFDTDGCGSSVVCASAACELAVGKSLEDAASVNGEMILQHLGGLPPDNRHCAYLAADTLQEALRRYALGEA